MIRVLHFSDPHIPVPLVDLPWRQMLNKRLIGGANWWLRRRERFRDGVRKLAALGRLAQDERVDLVVCTGDYTTLGTEPELRAARAAIEPLVGAPQGFVTVPGNHDLYLADGVREARFERVFGEFVRTDLPEYSVDEAWPTVRLFADALAVVCVNSARPNPQPWRSSGRIPEPQLAALGRVLADERLRERVVLVATHYAPRRRDGSPDRWLHGLENADALLEACARHPHAAILHGHIHWRYHLGLRGLPPMFGAGSATDAGREGTWLFEIDEGGLRASPGAWYGDAYGIDRHATVEPWGPSGAGWAG